MTDGGSLDQQYRSLVEELAGLTDLSTEYLQACIDNGTDLIGHLALVLRARRLVELREANK